jgi:excinuclease ABC subunit A
MLAPFMTAKPAVLRDELPRLQAAGLPAGAAGRGGQVARGAEARAERGGGPVAVDLVVDRVVLTADQRSRLADSLELAFREGRDRASGARAENAADTPWRELHFSQHLSLRPRAATSFAPLAPQQFSFNHREGACPDLRRPGAADGVQPMSCSCPKPGKSVRGGAIKPWRIGGRNLIIRHSSILKQLAEQLPFDAEIPWQELPAETRHILLHGAGERLFSFRVRKTQKAEAKTFPA